MGQIKNIKLHIVTDIKKPKQTSKQVKMARSLRSSRRKKNKQALRARYKPIYDKRLQEIVKNMQEQTDDLMETAGDIDLEHNVQLVDPGAESTMVINDDNTIVDEAPSTAEVCGDKEGETTSEATKNKMPRVDIKKLTKFMSQRKLRKYHAKEKAKKKAAKMGQKKKKTFTW